MVPNRAKHHKLSYAIYFFYFRWIDGKFFLHIKTSQSICFASQLNGFYMLGSLVINDWKDFWEILYGRIFVRSVHYCLLPVGSSLYLIVSIKHESNVWNLSKVNNINTRTMSLISFLASFIRCSGFSNVEFEQKNGSWDRAMYRNSAVIN